MKKDKIVEAHPQISLLSQIMIKEKENLISIGGFSIDGGFYLKSPYELIKGKEKESIGGDMITYYNFIKSSNKMCKQEKVLRKIEADKVKWKKEREKELEEELNEIKKNKK